MVIKFIGRRPDVKTNIVVGNRGDSSITPIYFVMPRMYGEIDLSTLIPKIDWIKATGEQGTHIASIDTTNTDLSLVMVTWLLPYAILATAGKGTFCVSFFTANMVTMYRTDNIYISVNDTIDVTPA